jgi:hypothetical protein
MGSFKFLPGDCVPSTFGMGGNAAPFIHDLLSRVLALEGQSGAQSQAAWFIDPQNGHDGNTGASPGSPLKTFAQLVAKWGTSSPVLQQDTVITFLSSQTDDSDPVILPSVYLGGAGATLTIKGERSQIGAGTFSGVVAKNQSTGQLWNVNLGQPVAPFVGQLLEDVTTGAFMWVIADLGGHVAQLSQPLAATSVAGYGTLNAELDSLANTNAYKVFSLTNVVVVQVGALPIVFNGSFTNGIVLQDLHVFDPAGPDLNDVFVGLYAGVVECSFDRDMIATFEQDVPSFVHNSYMIRTFGNKNIYGGVCTLQAIAQGLVTTEFGPFWDDDFAVMQSGGTQQAGLAVGAVYLGTGGGIEVNSSLQATGTGPLWGPGTLDHRHGGKTYYGDATSAATFFLLSGGITLNGVATANSIAYSGGVGTIHTGIALSAANLDAAAGAAGFGGLAWDPVSGSLISNAIP